MIFKEGLFKHKSGFTVRVDEHGNVFVSPDHKLTYRTSEIFDAKNWEEVKEDGSKK